MNTLFLQKINITDSKQANTDPKKKTKHHLSKEELDSLMIEYDLN